MLKRALMIAVLSFGLMAPVASHAADAPKIAVIDFEKVKAESKAGKSLQKQIEAKREAFSKEFSEKDKSLKAAQAEVIEAKEKLSAEEFNKKRKAFEAKVAEVKLLFEKRSNGLRQGIDKSMLELSKTIIESAADVADKKGFDIVLSRDSVVIADKELDITQEVLGVLDAKLTDLQLKVE